MKPDPCQPRGSAHRNPAQPAAEATQACAELQPIDTRQQQVVRLLTHARIDEAARHYGRHFDYIPVSFNLGGRAAGQFRYQGRPGQRHYQIRYNPWVFAVDPTHHQVDTVAHEVAHYIVHLLHPRAQPHGREWKALMRHFGATPRATSYYDIRGVPVRRQQRHDYRCGCSDMTHALSTTRHRRILEGARYLCRRCRQSLHPA